MLAVTVSVLSTEADLEDMKHLCEVLPFTLFTSLNLSGLFARSSRVNAENKHTLQETELEMLEFNVWQRV